jgi:hypothetical protein
VFVKYNLLKESHKLQEFVNGVLRKIFESKRDMLTFIIWEYEI